MDALEKELATARADIRELKAFAADLKSQIDKLNEVKAKHAKCAGQLKEVVDRLKEQKSRNKTVAEELQT